MTITAIDATYTPLTLADVENRFAHPPQDITVDFVTIDAEVASRFLQANTHNRTKNRNRVQQHTDTMLRGRWVQNGDSVRISKTGVLLDKQHVLSAIVNANAVLELEGSEPIAFDYLVVWGLEDESQDFMDTGSKRSLSHALELKNEKNPNQLGGATRMIWQIEHGATPTKLEPEPTYAEYYEYIEDNPDIRDSTQVGIKVARTMKVPPASIAAAHYWCAQKHPDEADDFFADLGDIGAQLDENSPVLGLRMAVQKWTTHGSVSRTEQASLYDVCIRAFKDHIDGKTIRGAYRLNRRPRQYRTM